MPSSGGSLFPACQREETCEGVLEAEESGLWSDLRCVCFNDLRAHNLQLAPLFWC